jgi:hypothetical protein
VQHSSRIRSNVTTEIINGSATKKQGTAIYTKTIYRKMGKCKVAKAKIRMLLKTEQRSFLLSRVLANQIRKLNKLRVIILLRRTAASKTIWVWFSKSILVYYTHTQSERYRQG